jgi:hypothetical protein
MRKVAAGGGLALIVIVACGEHAPGAYEQGGRTYPTYDIGIACSNGTPNGQPCGNNFQCCSGICCYPCSSQPGQGLCVQCETDQQCTSPLFPVCAGSTCVSGSGTGCASLGAPCTFNTDCCNNNCDQATFHCSAIVKDSGTGD